MGRLKKTFKERLRDAELKYSMLSIADTVRYCGDPDETGYDEEFRDIYLGDFLVVMEKWLEFNDVKLDLSLSLEEWEDEIEHVFRWAGLL